MMVSVLLPPAAAAIVAVILATFSPILGGTSPTLKSMRGGIAEYVGFVSYARYTMPLLVCAEYSALSDAMQPDVDETVVDVLGFSCDGAPGAYIWPPLIIAASMLAVVIIRLQFP
jgi:hypothetical protein